MNGFATYSDHEALPCHRSQNSKANWSSLEACRTVSLSSFKVDDFRHFVRVMECVWTNSLSRPYAPRSWVLSWVVLSSTPSAWVRAVSLVGAVTLIASRHGAFQDEDHRGWLGLSGTHLESFPFKIPSELGIPSTTPLREGPMEMGGGLRIGEGGSHFQPLGKYNLGSPWRSSGFCMQQS